MKSSIILVIVQCFPTKFLVGYHSQFEREILQNHFYSSQNSHEGGELVDEGGGLSSFLFKGGADLEEPESLLAN